MEILIRGTITEPILFIIPENHEDCGAFEEFARIDEPLVAVIKHDRAYQDPHIEIRKERT